MQNSGRMKKDRIVNTAATGTTFEGDTMAGRTSRGLSGNREAADVARTEPKVAGYGVRRISSNVIMGGAAPLFSWMLSRSLRS
jgi:hypothetical protein